jgi:hypothetical protein
MLDAPFNLQVSLQRLITWYAVRSAYLMFLWTYIYMILEEWKLKIYATEYCYISLVLYECNSEEIFYSYINISAQLRVAFHCNLFEYKCSVQQRCT